MPQHQFYLEIAEFAIVILGTVIIIGFAVHLSARRRWPAVRSLPSIPRHHVSAFDVLGAFWLFLLLFSILVTTITRLSGGFVPTPVATTSQATSQTSDDADSASISVIANSAALMLNCAVLIFIGRSRFDGGLRAWGLSIGSFGRNLVIALTAYVAIWPVCLILLSISTWITVRLSGPVEVHPALMTLGDSSTPAWIAVLTTVGAVVLAPIVEELLFRGLLLPALAQHLGSEWRAIIYSGLIFGLVHVMVPQSVPSLVFFGIALGYAYVKTRSLTLVILIHAVFNTKSVIWTLCASGG